MRVVLFSCVVMVHTVGTINGGADVDREMSGLSMLMHYTRYGFVLVTVFVLFLGYYHKDTRARTFWRKRFGLVVLPYLVWSLIYVAWNTFEINGGPWPGFGEFASSFARSLVLGDAKYQMYFLLVSMQIYFLFPAMRWLVKKTEGHHGLLFVAGTAVQLGMFCWLTFADPSGFWNTVQTHAWKALPTYAMLCVIGALAAVHFERTKNWFATHVPLVLGLSAVGATLTIGWYLYRTADGTVPAGAASAASPALIPWMLAANAALYVIAAAWNERRGDGSGFVARVVDLGSVRAFGLFAAHPLVIEFLLRAGLRDWLFSAFPGSTLVRSLLLVVLVFAGTLALVEVCLHTPLAKALVARSRQPIPGIGKGRKAKKERTGGGGDVGTAEPKRAEEKSGAKTAE